MFHQPAGIMQILAHAFLTNLHSWMYSLHSFHFMNVFPAYFPTIGDWKACNFLLAWFSHWVLLVFEKNKLMSLFFFFSPDWGKKSTCQHRWVGRKGKAHKLQNMSTLGGSLLTHCLQWRHKLGQSWKELWKSEKFFNNLTLSQKAHNLCHFWYYHQNIMCFGTISRWEGKEEVMGLWCWHVLPVSGLWIRRTWPWPWSSSLSQHPCCRDNAQPLLVTHFSFLPGALGLFWEACGYVLLLVCLCIPVDLWTGLQCLLPLS